MRLWCIKNMIKTVAGKVCRASRRMDLYEDFVNEGWVIMLETVKEDSRNTYPLLFTRLKYKLIDELRSRRTNYSYENAVPHLSLDYDLNGDNMAAGEIDNHYHLYEFIVDNISTPPDEKAVNAAFFAECKRLIGSDWDILFLWRHDGYTQQEIGDQIGLSRSMVSKIITRAYKALRSRL